MNPNLTDLIKSQLGLSDDLIADDVLEYLEAQLVDGATLSLEGAKRKVKIKDD